MSGRTSASPVVFLALLLCALVSFPSHAGEWTTSQEDGTKTFTNVELDYQITVPPRYVASELTGQIEREAGATVCDFAVADHPVDLESAVTVAAGSCRIGETNVQGDAGQIAAVYRAILLGMVKCTEREELREVELGGYSCWKLSVREENGLFLQPMNLDFYLRNYDGKIVILGLAYYDGYEEEIAGILASVRKVQE